MVVGLQIKTEKKKPKETPAPAPPPPPEKEVIGSGKSATSAEHKSQQSYSEATQQQSPSAKHNYYDKLESDSDDVFGMFDREDNDNTKNASSSYCIASSRRTAISSTFSDIARGQLKDMPLADKAHNKDVCCADSGATRHMFPDYKTFLGYHPCRNKTVKLGDPTDLPILGYGTAKFSLSGKVILVPNALHVPGLTDPLYSLRQHCYHGGMWFLFPS